jgi:hypothetical protein
MGDVGAQREMCDDIGMGNIITSLLNRFPIGRLSNVCCLFLDSS